MPDVLQELMSAELGAPSYIWTSAIVAIVLLALFIRRKQSFLSRLFRIALLALLVFSLTAPATTKSSSSEEFVALFDVSKSISKRARTGLLESLTPFVQGENERSLSMYTFGESLSKDTLRITKNDTSKKADAGLERISESLNTGESNIARGIDEVISSTGVTSLLLLTDGHETSGDARKIARTAAAKGVRIYPLIPDETLFAEDKLTISSLYAPITANAGDKAVVRVAIKNTASSEISGTLQVSYNDKKLTTKKVRVPGGEERLITIETPELKGGLHRVHAALLPSGKDISELIEKHRWISVKEKSKILLLSGTKDDQRVLRRLFQLKGYALNDIVADGRTRISTDFKGFSTIVLNNVGKAQLPKDFLPELEKFVSNGGGLLLVGGDRSFGLGGYLETPLETISPLKFVPPQTKKRRINSAVALLLDKSRSMSRQNKILSAKRAAITAIRALKDDDFATIIGFDKAPFQILEMMRVREAKQEAERRLVNLVASGGTHPLTSISLARSELNRSKASRKHIIILTDGEFEKVGSNYIGEIRAARREGITISTVALGTEADVPFLRVMANEGGGAFYQTLDATRLPQIFVRDIQVSVGEQTLKEKGPYPIAVGQSGLHSTSLRRYPSINGFVETLPKRGAQLELVTRRTNRVYPLLASWDYKRGRVTAFTSDANGRWSQPWISWDGFSKFWSQVLESTKKENANKESEVDFDLRYRVDSDKIVLDLAIFDPTLTRRATPTISARIIEPGGETKEIGFRAAKRGRFFGELENARPGDYKIYITYGNLKLPPLAITVGGDAFGEREGQGLNITTLSDIAYLSGGSINPSPQELQGAKRQTIEKRELYWIPALFAFFLIFIEAFIRERGANVFGLLFKRPSTESSPNFKNQGIYAKGRNKSR